MPDYTHVTREMTTGRVRAEINNKNICHPSVIVDDLGSYKDKNNSDSILLSDINSILLPHGVAFNSNKLSLSLNAPLKIEKLLSSSVLIGGITSG